MILLTAYMNNGISNNYLE